MAGRKPKYLKEYDDRLIVFMSDGYSFEAFAGEIGVAKQTLYNWLANYPSFLDAKKIADSKCRLWWEKQGIQWLSHPKAVTYNVAMWVFNMKNRFGWRDSVELIESSDTKSEDGPKFKFVEPEGE